MGEGAHGINFLMEGATLETYLLLVLFRPVDILYEIYVMYIFLFSI